MEAQITAEDRINRILEAINDSEISSIKSVVGGIIQLINDPNSTVQDLEEIIRIDPPLTAKLLRVANSPFYAPNSPIDSISKAVVWVGYNTVRELALRQKACELFDKEEVIVGYRRSEIWSYSVATAHFAKMIYRREYGLKGDDVYSAGLLHKIGFIAEEQFIKKAFTKVLEIAQARNAPVNVIEQSVFGFDHTKMGLAIARNWGLPEEISNAIGFHLNPFEVDEKWFRISATLYVAAVQCHFAQIGYSAATPFDDDVYQHCLQSLNLDQESLNMIIQEGQLEIAEMLEKGAL